MSAPNNDEAIRAALDELLQQLGTPGLVHYAGEPNADAPLPPSGPWVIVATDEGFHVGGVARHQFTTYELVPDIEAALVLIKQLLVEPPRTKALRLDMDEAIKRGIFTARKIHARTEERGGEAGPAVLQPGDLLDALEAETAHTLYPLGTPMEQRSLPPSALEAPYTMYEVVQSFGGEHPGVIEGTVAPWFGQPGGGAQVVLDRPIRFYVDAGYLVRLVETPQDESGPDAGVAK